MLIRVTGLHDSGVSGLVPVSFVIIFLLQVCLCIIIKGKRVNKGGDYGLKVPFEYLFQGDSFSCGFLEGLLAQTKPLLT